MLDVLTAFVGFKEYRNTFIRKALTIPVVLNDVTSQRAAAIVTRFQIATPRSRHAGSGQTASAWQVKRLGPMTYAVVNTYVTRGFSPASGLLTGTGMHGLATPGYPGSFKDTWHGMAPNQSLRYAWIDESKKSFATPRLFR